jgi:hypothetical protein
MWVSTFEHTSEYWYQIVLKAWCLMVIIGSKADFWWLVSGGMYTMPVLDGH